MVTEIKIEEVLKLYTAVEVDKFLKKYTGYDLNEKRIEEKYLTKNWKFLGDNHSNLSSIGILANGENGIIERITNAIDAVIEKQKEKNQLHQPSTALVVIKKAFPTFYQKYQSAINGHENQMMAYDADGQVMLIVNDSDKETHPTFDILDQGIGVEGKDFKHTLLSLSGGNKLSADQKYLIGAFGQGGSTSLPFANSTIIFSKKGERIFFTIIKKTMLKNYKTPVYMYLTFNDKIPELITTHLFAKQKNQSVFSKLFNEHLWTFLKSESGTLVRMVETDISRNLIYGNATLPGKFVDFVNTKLFATALPVKIIENRQIYLESNRNNNDKRNAFGTELRLKTWTKNVQKKYMGSIDLIHDTKTVKVDYYIILPTEKNKWGNDAECKNFFKMFSFSLEPIIYTVNGQTISTESYAKIKKFDLNFLKYRLLIVINLDSLEEEKYNFVTSSRSQIKETSNTKKLLNEVLTKIASNSQIQEINEIIAQKSITNSALDEAELQELSSEVKNVYGEMLKNLKPSTYYTHQTNQTPNLAQKANDSISKNKEFLDEIQELKVWTQTPKFYVDETLKFTLETKAKKQTNQQAKISAYLDGQEYREFSPDFMNGRITYLAPESATFKLGKHKIYFMLFQKNDNFLKSNEFEFEISNEVSPSKILKANRKSLTLEIKLVEEGKELISELVEDKTNKKLTVYINLNNQHLKNEIYKRIPKNSSDKMNQVKKEIVKPIALFTLLLKDFYEGQTPEAKNQMIVSHVKSFVFNQKN